MFCTSVPIAADLTVVGGCMVFVLGRQFSLTVVDHVHLCDSWFWGHKIVLERLKCLCLQELMVVLVCVVLGSTTYISRI